MVPLPQECVLCSDAFLSVLHLQGLLHPVAGSELDLKNAVLHQKQLGQGNLLSLFTQTSETERVVLDHLQFILFSSTRH